MVTEDDISAVVNRLLKTADGKILFKHLNTKYYDCRFKNDNLERAIGARDVLHYIKLLEQTNE